MVLQIQNVDTVQSKSSQSKRFLKVFLHSLQKYFHAFYVVPFSNLHSKSEFQYEKIETTLRPCQIKYFK